MTSSQLYPDVLDGSSVAGKFSAPIFQPIGVEGAANASATANVAQVYQVSRPSEADTLFGVCSLTDLIKFLLDRGAGPVWAVASKKASPVLAERQVAWANLEAYVNPMIRIRLTDSTTQADLVALATSAVNAELVGNKQTAIVGMPSGTSKANLIAAATAIGSKRGVLVGPGVYDNVPTLQSGAFAAAAVAAEVSRNSDPADDLDLLTLPNLTGIEKDSVGNPVFRVKVASGSVVNDLEDLLQGGVSPLQANPTGGVRITHLRTTYTTDGSFDSLQTRLIADQVFVDVKEYLLSAGFLRLANSERVRGLIKSGVEAVLDERQDWIQPKVQPDGTTGYNVSVSSSLDERQVTVSYEGKVVRGISTILVAATLEIPV
jgi:hypothetical protein